MVRAGHPTRLRQPTPIGSLAKTKTGKGRLPWPVTLFLVGLFVPWILPFVAFELSVPQLVLLIMVLPCVSSCLQGKAGKVRFADIAIILFCIWGAISLVAIHGLAVAAKPAGMLFVETAGAYFMARCYIRDADSFSKMAKLMTKTVLVLLPFALIECLTGSKPLLWAFGLVFPTVDVTLMTPRSGLWRVQGPFAHSILFGTIVGSVFALATSVAGYGRPLRQRSALAGTVSFTAALSLSSAPLAGLVLQMFLLTWDWLFKAYAFRWKILFGCAFAAYLVVEFGSNQTPVQFYISKFTFDQQTGWSRLWIWEYGSASVMNHPLIGIGLSDWARPWWLHSDSVDNFWLLTAMRYGIPALLALMLACLCLILPVALRKMHDPRLDSYRTIYTVCIASLIFIGTTVHYWGSAYLWFIFLLGAGAWLLDADVKQRPESSGRMSVPNRDESAPDFDPGREGMRPTRERPGTDGRGLTTIPWRRDAADSYSHRPVHKGTVATNPDIQRHFGQSGPDEVD